MFIFFDLNLKFNCSEHKRNIIPRSNCMSTLSERNQVHREKIISSVGQYLLDELHARGVEHIFGIPGDYIIRFDKLIEEHKIQFINATRESTAGYMADAYARIRGLGVACTTYGVGVNIANALSQAYAESSPLIVISGAPSQQEFIKSNHLHHLVNKADLAFQDITQSEIFKPVTIDQAILTDPSRAVEEIDRVLKKCLFYKKPVYIEIARDVVDQPVLFTERNFSIHPQEDAAALEEALEEVAKLLKECKKPVIWAGHEIHRGNLQAPLLSFAEKYRIPIATSLLGKSLFDENHPLSLGVYQGVMSRPETTEYVESCDCIFILGLVVNDVDTGIFTAKLTQNKKIIATENSLKIKHHQFLHVPLNRFVNALAHLNLNIRFPGEYPHARDRFQGRFNPAENSTITIKKFIECLQSHLTKDHIIVTDVGDCMFASADLVLRENTYFANAYFASLGFGTPGAIGAQIAAPTKRVIGLVGDGGFQMTATELATAVRYHLDLIIIVLNNHGYGTERPILEGNYNDILDWNYTKIPEVFGGGKGIKVTTEQEFDDALKEALHKRGTFYLIEVNLDKYDFSPALMRLGEEIAKHHQSTGE